MEKAEKKCRLCGRATAFEGKSLFADAGEWLAEDLWHDSGELCNLCLENRGRLAMMYLHDKNR